MSVQSKKLCLKLKTTRGFLTFIVNLNFYRISYIIPVGKIIMELPVFFVILPIEIEPTQNSKRLSVCEIIRARLDSVI